MGNIAVFVADGVVVRVASDMPDLHAVAVNLDVGEDDVDTALLEDEEGNEFAAVVEPVEAIFDPEEVAVVFTVATETEGGE